MYLTIIHHPSITGIASCWMPCLALPAKRLLTHCSTTNTGSVRGEICNVGTGREGIVSKWLSEDGKERLSTNCIRTKFSWIGARWSLMRTLLPQMGCESWLIFFLDYYSVGSKHAIIGLGNIEYMVWGEVTFTINLFSSSAFGPTLWPDLGAWRHIPPLKALLRHGHFWVWIGMNGEVLNSTLSWLVSCSGHSLFWYTSYLYFFILILGYRCVSLHDSYEPGSFSTRHSLQM